MEPVRWGMIGAGSWADLTFGPAICAAGNGELVAVLSSDEARAEAFCAKHGVARGYTDLETFLQDDAIEAVWVASPTFLHTQHTIAALEHGKHVLCEKPMAVHAADAQSMLAAAARADRLLSVAYHMRHHPLHQALQAEWTSGAFGKPFAARTQLFVSYAQPPAEWRRTKATSGGWAVCDIGTHGIDLLRWFLGEPEHVHAELSNLRFGLETDDYAQVTLRFAGGVVGVVEASAGTGAPPPRVELYGTEGYCILEGTLFGRGGSIARVQGGNEVQTTAASAADLYRLQAESFSRAVRGEEALAVTAEDGLENVRIIEQARGW